MRQEAVLTIKHALVCALLLTGCYALAELGLLFQASAAAVQDVSSQVATTRDMLAGKMDRIVSIADSLPERAIPPILSEVRRQGDRITDKADARLASAQSDARDAVFLMAGSVDSWLSGVLADLRPALSGAAETTAHLSSIAAQVDAAAPLYLDCGYNPDCAFNRFQGASKAVEQMAQAGAAAAPKIVVSAESLAASSAAVAADAKKEADALTAPKSVKRQILDGVKLAALLARFVF